MVSAPQRRAGVDFLRSKGVSLRRCSRLFDRSRTSLRFRRRSLTGDVIAERVQTLAHTNPRYGYRRVWILLRREGRLVNVKRIHRHWKLQGLQVRRKAKKRIRTGQTVPMKALYPNHVWTYDFVKDAALNGDEIRCLTVTDEFSKESHAIEVEGSFSAMNQRNLAALKRVDHLLAPDAARVVRRFTVARAAWFLPRVAGVARSGVYHHTLLGTMGLIVAMLFKKL